jgi:NAD(P)-dependent dehydrogenase (short-subunit alcohol dehydrogenase family)
MQLAQEPRPATRHKYPSLAGRSAIVTGGGRGLGRVMALALVEQGVNVMITGSRAPEELGATAAEARALGPGSCATIRADVSDPENCEEVVRATLAAFGTVDILVNNAARGPLEQLDEAGKQLHQQRGLPTMPNTTGARPSSGRFWEGNVDGNLRMLMTNYGGPYLMARACVPHMVEFGFGRIVNISTSRSTMIRLAQGPYGPLKAALEASTRIWAAELEGTGVTANILLPGGAADTSAIPGEGVGNRAAPFIAGEGPRGQEGMAKGLLPPAIMAPPLLWLVSDEANGATGRRFVARDWSDAILPADAAALAEADRIEWPHII